MDSYSGNSNKVDILITAPSDNEIDGNAYSDDDEFEEDDEDYIYNDNGENNSDTLSETTDTNEQESVEIGDRDTETSEDKLCENFATKANVSRRSTSGSSDEVVVCEDEEKPAFSDEKLEVEGKNDDKGALVGQEQGTSSNDDEGQQQQGQNYEIVGDRVLVEKDGKFELVDANEIKAEYFEMLGIKPAGENANPQKPPISSAEQVEGRGRERPKTTPARATRLSDAPPTLKPKRVQSSWGGRRRNNDYGNIRSPYGLTDKQMEIKRKREEAMARRRKEEEEMAREEERRKREDAERAFQAWLQAKREDEKERRQAALQYQKEEGRSSEEAEQAFKAWKTAKKKQQQVEKEESQRRMEETASMYVVHDRDTCEDAFKSWLRKKRGEKKVKEAEKKKKQRPKSRRKPKEPLPVNSDKIRFTDNYGYRNAVVY